MTVLADVIEKTLSQRAPRSQFVHSIGVELEGFTSHLSCSDLPGVAGGIWTDDAGLNLCEAITIPFASVPEVVRVLQQLVEQLPSVTFTPFRPPELMHNKGRWQSKPRYGAVVAALRAEKPEDHEWVERMTDFAALQVSISGRFEPFGDEGAFLVSIFNDIAPWIAAQVHRDVGQGVGHLALWQRFAREERLPQYGRWFKDGRDMVSCIESVPKLVRQIGVNGFELNPGEQQSIKCLLDLGVMWWFVRPRDGEYGQYLEFRFLPSMPPHLAGHYAQLVVDMVEVLLDWFHGPQGSRPVTSAQEAVPAYQLLSRHFPDHTPTAPLTAEQWLWCLNS